MAKSSRAARRSAQAASTRSAIKSTNVDTDSAPKRKIVRSSSKAQDKALAKAKEDSERIKEAVTHTPLLTDIPTLPRSGRPPEVRQGEGGQWMVGMATHTGSSMVVIEMDTGAFRWLWERAESNGLDCYRRYNGIGTHDGSKGTQAIADAAVRAIEAMRKTGHEAWPSYYTDSKPAKRRIVRRSSTKEEVATTPKRVIKRKSKG